MTNLTRKQAAYHMVCWFDQQIEARFGGLFNAPNKWVWMRRRYIPMAFGDQS